MLWPLFKKAKTLPFNIPNVVETQWRGVSISSLFSTSQQYKKFAKNLNTQ